ncbi:MAG: DUF4982 domain-containing protein [Chitinispirillaceae bacterium]|nr:DUF4982 domain-containing protein [Chitinispirillaceae bacterium]
MLGVLFPAMVVGAPYTPPQTARVKFSLNKAWKFTMSDVSGAHAATFDDVSWSTVHLPHNFQDVSIAGGGYYRGPAWYRRHFTLDASFRGKQIAVYFEGAMTVAECWINGTKLATHYGGFSPFCHDITPYCTFDSTENVIVVRLTNEYQTQVPPEKPDGSFIDFEMYGGIYRGVRLIATDKVFVPEAIHAWANGWNDQGGHFITFTNVSASSAVVNVRTWVKNASAASVNIKVGSVIVSAQGQALEASITSLRTTAVNEVAEFAENITISNPTLWYPWAPCLYTVHSVVYVNDQAVDLYSTRIGIRTVQFTRSEGVKCNGVAFKLLGLNRHQMWPFVGHAVPDIQQRRDAEILRDASCNFVRCSHYLQDEEFMNACDSLGVLLWVELPGWHCCNNEGMPLADVVWRNRHYDEIRFMVRSARNHPCVALWAPAINEAHSDPTIEQPLNDLCHQEDSSRMTSAARHGVAHPVGAGSNIYDVYGDNQFVPGSIPAENPDNTTYGYINTEHTGHTYQDSSRRETCVESALISHAGRHMLMTAEARTRGAWVHGGMGWCAFDYYTEGSVKCHGVMDIMHYPKFAFWFYKSQSAADNYDGSKNPMVKIANWYRQSSPAAVKVFHNCEQVRLFSNNTLIAAQGPDTVNVAHPPSTFNVTWQPGTELRAEGVMDGVVVARDTVRTPGSPCALRLTADPARIEANGGDFSRVIVEIVDSNGTYVPYTADSIHFALSGPGTLIGDNPFRAQSGVAMNLAKARRESGTITVTATSPGLAQGTVAIQAVAPPPSLHIRPIASRNALTAFKAAETMITSCSNIIALHRFIDGTGAGIMVFDLKGRLLYRGMVDKPVIDLSKKVALPNGVRIVKVVAMPGRRARAGD